MRPYGLLLMFAVPALLAGCANDIPEDGASDDDAQSAHGLQSWVVVERVEEADGRVRTNVSAKFVHVAEGDVDAARRLIGARPSIPPAGDCVPLASLEQNALQGLGGSPAAKSANGSMSVDLLDVGNVTVAIQNGAIQNGAIQNGAIQNGTLADPVTRVSLSPRAFPDIGDLVSGVFYTSPDASIGLPVPADYEIGGTGSASLDAFVIDARAPDAPRNVVIAGDPAPEEDDDWIDVRANADIQLDWASDGAADSLVYVDVRAGLTSYRCTFADGGAAVLPAGVLAEAAGVSRDETAVREGSITLHRLTERAATMRSVSSTEEAKDATVVFDFARTVHVSVR